MHGGSGSDHHQSYLSQITAPLRSFTKSRSRSSSVILCCVFFLLVGALVYTRMLDTNIFSGSSTLTTSKTNKYPYTHTVPKLPQLELPLNCSTQNRICSKHAVSNYSTTSFHQQIHDDDPNRSTCPEYFRWIHEDLRPWAQTGITREMLERANKTANFRLVILNGRVYIEKYQRAFQTRDVFTMWGIIQLLRKYPGKLPDLEMMFDCVDWPVLRKKDYSGPDALVPPPLFRYCTDDESFDIPFPDWSFWGWPETNIKPWEPLLKELLEGNNRINWMNREPYAYWKGNPKVSPNRVNLLKCNVSENQDWNARLYEQDWSKEIQAGFKTSDLASQCAHRFKIYIEGSAWSVSEKYILACDSVPLIVKPHYYDFFTRSLIPIHHYWPIKDDDKCRSIKFAVDWGNSHKQKSQAIAKAASRLIQEELKMDYVYDYMFHLLNQYSKLLRFKPKRPKKSVEFCIQKMVCRAQGLERQFMMDSLVKDPSETGPCTLAPPYDPPSLNAVLRRKEDTIEQVERWERNYWEKNQEQN